MNQKFTQPWPCVRLGSSSPFGAVLMNSEESSDRNTSLRDNWFAHGYNTYYDYD